jgi:release factor glutamine methyltransferase
MPLIREVLQQAAGQFSLAGIDTARLDAEVLLRHVLDVDRARLLLLSDSPLDDGVSQRFQELCRRRIAREPVAYITGHREFYGLDFAVDSRVLVPRPETELLVDLALYNLRTGGRMLDVCTGSGAVAIAVRSQRPDVMVAASDISLPALDCARENVLSLLGDAEAIELVQSDLCAAFAGRTFHLITANPPYIAAAERVGLAPELDYEPQLALVAPDNGLEIIRRLVEQAPRYLVPDGMLLFEMGSAQAGAAQELAVAAGFSVTMYQDYAGLPRLAACRRS